MNQYLRSLSITIDKMHHLLMKWMINWEDLCTRILAVIVLSTTNEEQKKLEELVPISPILIDSRQNRFFSSNMPP